MARAGAAALLPSLLLAAGSGSGSGSGSGAGAGESGAVLTGAIRWDAWFGAPAAPHEGIIGRATTKSLTPAKFHYRLPFFSKIKADGSVEVNGDSAAVMAQENKFATQHGIDYYAFCTCALPLRSVTGSRRLLLILPAADRPDRLQRLQPARQRLRRRAVLRRQLQAVVRFGALPRLARAEAALLAHPAGQLLVPGRQPRQQRDAGAGGRALHSLLRAAGVPEGRRQPPARLPAGRIGGGAAPPRGAGHAAAALDGGRAGRALLLHDAKRPDAGGACEAGQQLPRARRQRPLPIRKCSRSFCVVFRSLKEAAAQNLVGNRTTAGFPYADNMRFEQGWWRDAAATGMSVVVPVSAGWDSRPRQESTMPWGDAGNKRCLTQLGHECWLEDPTMPQLTEQTKAALEFASRMGAAEGDTAVRSVLL